MLLRIMKALIQKAFLVEYKYSKEREEEEEQLLWNVKKLTKK